MKIAEIYRVPLTPTAAGERKAAGLKKPGRGYPLQKKGDTSRVIEALEGGGLRMENNL